MDFSRCLQISYKMLAQNYSEFKTCDSRFKFQNSNASDVNDFNLSILIYSNSLFEILHTVFTEYFSTVFLSLIISIIIYYLYKVYWDPILYKKDLTEVGFDHIPAGADRERRIARAQALRRIGNKLPPPYPNGWFAVAESAELPVGGTLPVDALGENLCVYRGTDGVARVVEAYCPHLGAHLAVGGLVCGDHIQCPFHKWRFDSQGQCVYVPGAEKAPKGVSIRTWYTAEAEGAVWVWYDAEQRPPAWPLLPDTVCSSWGYRGRNEFYVSAHVQEIPENGADVMHLEAVHADSVIVSLGEKFSFLKKFIGHHIWAATWASNGNHTATMKLTHEYELFGKRILHTDIDVTQLGPGHVRLHVKTPLGPILISQSVTPLGPLLQKVVDRIYSPAYNAAFGRYFVVQEGRMIERDIKIWNSKVFVSAPTYVKADKTIRAFRNWFSQFYTENSIAFKDSFRNNLDW